MDPKHPSSKTLASHTARPWGANAGALLAAAVVVSLLGPSGVTGCGASAAQRGRVIEMPPEIVTPDDSPSDAALEMMTDSELFEEGNTRLREGEYHQALRRYRLLTERSGDESYVRAALYNAGLCFEGLDDWEAASRHYERVVDNWPASNDATDSLYRWAEARSQLGDYEGVLPLMERALRRARLTMIDRAEANLRLANATIEMRDWAHAERYYRAVLQINRDAQLDAATSDVPADQPLPDYHPIIAQSHFGLGRTYHELFLEIKLVLPQESIQRALVDKSQLMEQARLAYLDAVRSGHVYWSVAAGFMIGQIYEDFYLDVLACEVPSEFEGLTLEEYFRQLRAFLQPVVARALDIYEDNLSMAERMGADSVWVEETELGIERVQRYMFDEDLQREQEQQILEQRHPHSARDPDRAWRGVAEQSTPSGTDS